MYIFKKAPNTQYLIKGNILINIFVLMVFLFPYSVFAENYYWVGGNGNWSDINHWAVSSGGTVLHSQTPTPNDDVFFDVNSFNSSGQIVTINQKNAVCRNLIWTGVTNLPEISGHDTTSLRIYGNLEFTSGMVQNFHGEVIFESGSTGKTIKTAEHVFLNNIHFLGIGGGWQFQDDFKGNRNIYFVHGILETNGFNLTCVDFLSLNPNNRKILLSTSSLNLVTWQINGENLVLQATSAVFNIETLLLNQNGNHLFYNNINFYGFAGTINNSNVYVTYNNIEFAFDGIVTGDCKINTLTTIGSGSIADSDSINQVIFNGSGNISGGHHVIGTFIGKDISFIEGNNEIGVALLHATTRISGTNKIDSAFFYESGIISESNQIRKLIISRSGIIEGDNNITDALMLGDGYFDGPNFFETLTLSPGNTYTFGIEDTQTIDIKLNISGNCYKPIRILSDTNGVQAIIKCNTPVQGDYLSLRDIKAEGTISFQATNSVDLGNNSNWDIETSFGIDLYWVNGQGDWDNPVHWDIISGGPGGHCPPTEIDNATFDANSFSVSSQTVNLNIKNAVCYNMLWENINNPLFIGPDTNNLRIYGSLTLSPQMQWMFLGPTFFEATELGKTITSSGNIFINNTWFNGRGGSWSLLDRIETTQNIMFQQGEIFSLGNEIKCNIFSSTDTTTRKLWLSTSTVIMTKAFQNVWDFNAENLELHADSSLLISEKPGGVILSYGDHELFYNNVEFHGYSSSLLSSVYCNYNLVTFFDSVGSVKYNCTIDTVIFHETKGTVLHSDTIKTAIFYGKNGYLNGDQHIIEIAYFFEDGRISGINKIDTTLFYRNAIIEGSNTIDTCIIYNKAIIDGTNNIRTETLMGDGDFFGENIFHDLTLSKTRSYYLENNKTQTVHDNLSIKGSCTGPIILQSDKNQIQATIKKTNGIVEANYLSLRDINAVGPGIPFIAYNSVDLGNNTNWTINTSSPKELYWVEGNGHWSDSLHWSVTSGGIGGYCIPSPIDNVYFDENSFNNLNDSVLIDIGNATCHNMSWNGSTLNPIFASPGTNNLRIFGSLELNSNMFLDIYGPTFFESTHNNNTIQSKGIKFPNNIYFQGIGGQWILNDKLWSDSTIYFSNGEIITSSNYIECWAFNSDFTNIRNFNFSGSTIILNGTAIESWFMNGINLNISANNSLIKIMGINAIVRTEYGGPFIYNNFLAEGDMCRIYNIDVDLELNNVHFLGSGQIHGNCSFDTVSFIGDGSIFDADKIDYLEVKGLLGQINGMHEIKVALILNNSEIDGNNSIDTIITGGTSVLSGTNVINEFMSIGSSAKITGSNHAKKAVLNGDGWFTGDNSFGTLTFSPGNKYELEEGTTQTINSQFNIRGNNCFPITLRSQNDGNEAFISIPSEVTVSGDFIEMRDISAIGGAGFYAGKFSTDISNNTGWLFNNSPGYIFGFPADTTMCKGHELIIGTENFNPDESTTYLWQDGSILSNFFVTNEDSLWVTVNYAFDCSYTDTILINRSPSPDIDLGDDRLICEGDSILLINSANNLTYLWNNGSTDSIFIATESGLVSLTVTAQNGCFNSDSIEIITKPTPLVFLGNDTTLIWDETINLDAGNYGSTYIWSTGDSIQIVTVAGSEQIVWVYVSNNGCVGNDTIILSEFPRCIITVPNAFSPNGDGQNDILFVRGSGFIDFELLIFNRIGEMVFKTNNESNGWDGTFKGKPQEVDAYMYILKGRCSDGQDIFNKGNITLLR